MAVCEICGQGEVHRIEIEREVDGLKVKARFWGDCSICGVDYTDYEQSKFNAEQMKEARKNN